jgi:hypothetical protein
MSRFNEDNVDHEFSVQYGRPKAVLPIDKIMELHGRGYSCRDIVDELAKMGIKTSKDTINRRITKIENREKKNECN